MFSNCSSSLEKDGEGGSKFYADTFFSLANSEVCCVPGDWGILTLSRYIVPLFFWKESFWGKSAPEIAFSFCLVESATSILMLWYLVAAVVCLAAQFVLGNGLLKSILILK